MKTRFIIPVFAVIATLVLAFTMSAFKGETKSPSEEAKPLVTTYYFKYLPTSTFTEGSYETSSNWTYVGTSAGSDPCPGTDAMPCVIHADLTTGSNAPSDLVSFLVAQPSAKTYAETTSNVSHQKPNGE